MTMTLPAATDADSFNHALATLLLAASDNGVDVAGGWDCSTDGDGPDWDTVILELAPTASTVESTDGA
ncbi:hypothetical protein [Halomarina rubra]|uniref:Uncharacterized protein n=1 Tax=Halomarina rubra TaxID=2071873 RepID=A0ABD6AVB1_9EURY|nr:hypothetical protein [Halomarina rubra]